MAIAVRMPGIFGLFAVMVYNIPEIVRGSSNRRAYIMASDQHQIIADRERKAREQGQPPKTTLEVVGLERQGAPLPVWQQWIINALAVIGGLTVLYLILDKVF
jgi:hypothetical protein